MIVCLALRLQRNVIEHRRLHFGQLRFLISTDVPGRELKTAISLLNLKQFSRVRKKLPSNCTVNSVAVGGSQWTLIAFLPGL
jgi:hypothetical protein